MNACSLSSSCPRPSPAFSRRWRLAVRRPGRRITCRSATRLRRGISRSSTPSPLGVDGYAQGYADQLFKVVRDRYEQLRLIKLGCGGETTRTMVVGAPWCGFPAGSQLAQAERF
jgi:hypothetical protein